VTAAVTDAGSGIAEVAVDVGDSRGLPNVGTYCTMRPATADSSPLKCTLTLPSFTRLGQHPVRSVELIDRNGNARVYTNSQLLRLGFRAMLTVLP
jgi:hypothetical protein